ncbi:OmpW family outer membrane protein [Flavobacterium sp. WV_118_3]|uniref:OmpW/AlkL family protein n=1 Tax=Flavobacterium sp. WV_118_3 TaxID=3151764 RepID=UPI002C67633D|nr:OmpW family outer membrane protein [Flavobacterium sp.]
MKKITLLAAMVLLFGANATQAQETNTKYKSEDFKRWQVRVRGVGVVPNESADISTIGGDVSISNTIIPELDFSYFFTKNFAVELILGTSKHDVHTVGSDISAVGGPSRANVDLGSVRLLPPTLMAQYHFYPMNEKVFKPYVGAGLNYTIFYDVKAGNTVKDVKYDNALGYAVQAGFDLMVTDKFFINADVKRLFLKTDVTVDASNLADGLSIPADVKINPWLLGLGVGMKF